MLLTLQRFSEVFFLIQVLITYNNFSFQWIELWFLISRHFYLDFFIHFLYPRIITEFNKLLLSGNLKFKYHCITLLGHKSEIFFWSWFNDRITIRKRWYKYNCCLTFAIRSMAIVPGFTSLVDHSLLQLSQNKQLTRIRTMTVFRNVMFSDTDKERSKLTLFRSISDAGKHGGWSQERESRKVVSLSFFPLSLSPILISLSLTAFSLPVRNIPSHLTFSHLW